MHTAYHLQSQGPYASCQRVESSSTIYYYYYYSLVMVIVLVMVEQKWQFQYSSGTQRQPSPRCESINQMLCQQASSRNPTCVINVFLLLDKANRPPSNANSYGHRCKWVSISTLLSQHTMHFHPRPDTNLNATGHHHALE